jgi:hypothetical protein
MAEVDDSGRLIVPKTSAAPVIDGELDDVWQGASEESLLITDIINATSVVPDDASDLSGTFQTMYDDDNFYFFIGVQDSVLDYEFSNHNGDSVEIFFDGDNSKGSTYDGVNDNQIRINIDDVELGDLGKSLPIDGADFKVLLTDLGYNIEASFPLEKLQLVPENVFGFEVQLNDNDGGGGRETLIRWFSNDNNSWRDASLFGEAVLAAESEPVSVENLALNPSFEEDEVVLDDPEWYAWATWNPAEGAGSNATIVDTEAVDGKRSLRIEPVGVENWHFIVANISFPLTFGADYTTTFWAKAEEPRPLGAQIKAADNSVSWGYADFQLTTEWAEYTMTSIAESDAGKVEFFCAGVEVPLWLDFVNVYEGPYVPGIEPKVPVTIPVPNAGFEDPVLDEDGWTWLDVPGWTWMGGEGPGIWHVTSADFDPVVAPEGQNVLYTENAVGDAGGVTQVLTETFAANTDYTLTVEVGNSNYYYFAGYSVQLLAGGVVIAEDNDTLWPEYYKWATSTVHYSYDSADAALVGQPLEIRLLTLALDKDNPPENTVGVEFDNVTLSYVAGAEPGITIPVDPNSDLAAANELAQPGDTIEFAEGTYYITSQIIVKDGVTYKGAGPGLTIIDGNDTTRAFAAWGDRSFNEGNENPNDSGPKGWVIEGMTIQNCVADTNDRFSFTGSAFDMNDVFAENDADGSGGLNPEEADADSGEIRLPGPDGEEGTADDDLHRFEHMDTDGNGELSQEELLAQMAVAEDEFSDENRDGGALFCGNGAVGTIANCEFLNNHTPFDGDDGGAITIAGLSVVTVNDCRFVDNYAVSTDGVKLDGHDGDGGHIKVQGSSASAITPGTTLIANRCDFLGGKVEDDGAAIGTSAVGSIIRLDACWFEGNTAADDGTVLMIGNVSSGELTVTNCVFANNISTGGSDKMCHVKRNSKFVNCTFVGNNQDDLALIQNTANNVDTDGDGENDELADVTQVVNCVFVNNVVGNGDDVLKSRNNDFTIAATNCLFFGNTLQNGNPADNTQRPADEVGSILTDPLLDVLFVPGVGSPAIDAGVDPATIGLTITTDLSGNARPQGAAYDIGAYEVEAAPPAE